MPRGNPTAQTIASAKYQKKIGLVAKTYKLNSSLADEFKKTCDKLGVSQSSVISDFMRDFIGKNQ